MWTYVLEASSRFHLQPLWGLWLLTYIFDRSGISTLPYKASSRNLPPSLVGKIAPVTPPPITANEDNLVQLPTAINRISSVLSGSGWDWRHSWYASKPNECAISYGQGKGAINIAVKNSICRYSKEKEKVRIRHGVLNDMCFLCGVVPFPVTRGLCGFCVSSLKASFV